MKKRYYELTCDHCKKTAQVPDEHEPHGWYKCDEMVNGEGSDNTIYMFGGVPMLPTKHLCSDCVKEIFGTGEQQ